MSSLVQSEMNNSGFNLRLGTLLFSDPHRDKDNAIVVANHEDITAGIKANDLLRIDFTANKIDRDGLYVITLDDGWIGYRRFHFSPIEPRLRIIGSHHDEAATPDMLAKIKVVGQVKDIYQSRFNQY
ncbi:hypothetical protein [Methylotenera sp. G11]|uniref:hypothetical protein n=1 Tax=Methylotenera sp. G11 TaxID=1506585 RepID=UPI0006473872|nr:hypothetical protein [Methylotenera sp. G11]